MNNDLIELISVLCNRRDKFSAEAGRPGDGNKNRYNKNKMTCKQETCDANATLVQPGYVQRKSFTEPKLMLLT